jgi:hypothetical protein
MRWGAAVLLGAGAVALGGCLGKPEIQDRWTRLDVVSSNLEPGAVLPSGVTTITVRTAITYRHIVTGFAVAELRASSSLPASSVQLAATHGQLDQADRERMAADVDRVLANSVTMGRATRAITGWDHLIQRIDFSFRARVPAASDSAATGLFLICYLGAGDEMRRADGTDSLIVTPFPSTSYEILPVGMELAVAGGPQP